MILTVKDLFNRIQKNPQDYIVSFENKHNLIVLGITDNASVVANGTTVFGMCLIAQKLIQQDGRLIHDNKVPTLFIGMAPGNIVEVVTKSFAKKTL